MVRLSKGCQELMDSGETGLVHGSEISSGFRKTEM